MRLVWVYFLVLKLKIVLGTFNVYNDDTNIGCRDASNNLVDWFYLYKLPIEYKHKKHGKRIKVSSGTNYYYITSSESVKQWTYSSKTVDDPTSLLGNTINQIYNNSDVIGFMYNDQPPEGPVDFDGGHTKGVAASTKSYGFWLIHSVPHYPPTFENAQYSYPRTGHRYGQSCLCISMNSSMINLVAKQLIYDETNIYSHTNNMDQFKDVLPHIIDLINKVKITNAPFYNITTIESNLGFKFKVFAKAGEFDKELYNDLVAPTFQTSLLVETWLNGAGRMDSNCSTPFSVYNIADIKFSDDIHFRNHNDHSKWAVTKLEQNNWICVGDINREFHQLERGGGTVCQQNDEIASEYNRIINGHEPCPRYTQFYEHFNNYDTYYYKILS